MFAHIAYCVQYLHHSWVVVMANDTHVIMMCIYYSTCIAALKELSVHKMNAFLPSHEIAASLAVKYYVHAT